ncbi:MAG TPA: GNAT family N-acetyltransferase [Pyrinomonadaceae bacterium]|nr:GNAT family N-acetyltransferase [Pyrinomonadaceae bacterium]
MTNQLTIRPAKFEELPTLLEFELGIVTAERPFNPTLKKGEIHYYDLAALIESPLAAVYVAELAGELIASGYVLEKIAQDYLQHDRYGYLGFMFVRPDHRGKGVNQRILDALIEWGRKRGLTEFRLEVYSDNLTAISAYEKAGFKPLLLEMRMGFDQEA